MTYVGGNRTWRNQNPGNLGAGPWANRHGAIGKAGGFAVFPGYESGRAAIFDWWKTPDHRVLSIWDGIKVYAPASENDVEWYRKVVRQSSKIDLSRKAQDLKPGELERLVNAIEKAEGKFKAGRVIKEPQKKKIAAVKKDKHGTIFQYRIDGLGWISKARAIQLTSQGNIDAVIAISRSGNSYLKSRPDKDVSNNLDNLG